MKTFSKKKVLFKILSTDALWVQRVILYRASRVAVTCFQKAVARMETKTTYWVLESVSGNIMINIMKSSIQHEHCALTYDGKVVL